MRSTLLLTVLLLCGCTGQVGTPERVRLEFRAAQKDSAEGLTAMTLQVSGETFYLHDRVLISNRDIAAALVTTHDNRPVIVLHFTKDGRGRLATVTGEHVGEHLGMIIDGVLVSAPVVRAQIGEGRALIDGFYSESDAQRIARGLVWKTGDGENVSGRGQEGL